MTYRTIIISFLFFLLVLSFLSVPPLIVSLFGITICLFIFFFEKITSNNLLNPNIWFTPAFGIIQFTAVIFYTAVDDELPWFKNLMFLIESNLASYNSAIVLGILGFYLGFTEFKTEKSLSKGNITYTPNAEQSYTNIFIWSNFFLFLGLGLMFIEIVLSDSIEAWFTSIYSDSHNHNRPTYFWSQFSYIVWAAGFGGIITTIFFGRIPKKITLVFLFFHLLVFVLPRVLQGNRHFLFALIIQSYFIYYIRNPKSKIFKTKSIIVAVFSLMLSLVLLGVLRAYTVGVGLNEAELDNFWVDSLIVLLKNFTYSNTTTILIISHFPQSEWYLMGKTYFASILYLLPSFLFSGERLLAHLYFLKIFFSLEEDIGFGFTLLAEAYMNFGVFGCLFMSFFTARFVNYFYKRVSKNVSFFNISFYTHLIYQTFWYIRADSNAYSKSLFYYAIFTILIVLLSKKIKIANNA